MAAPWIQPPPTPFDPRGFFTGVLAAKAMERRGVRLRQFRWQYGPEIRERPFPEHQALTGRFMQPDGVLDGYWPGDHAGCRCMAVPVWVVEGTRTVVTAP